ncbi:MAG: 23S rRNA (adenine(2503)-C(2))-methyltransferase RlmN [Acutalibacter sp.]|uniref:23S rRNA (adenine(2503)-C(2))-methyltransferase RlmN n=1 Tax=Acutalibacter sp. TaxID=1918636 RepID=UPI002173EF6F|nr:23S rRNA (adenine(2503)-C(2))-methyltransferase RlmN [Acutalibacter sp.]MCI9226340.1 23S rRNA (adenine(2503)-C(2))-methyltransferase RlmN [Acutalibacter sp.]
MEKIDIKSMTPEELRAELPDLPKFRVKQIFLWLHRGVVSFDEMTDISKELRAMMAERYEIACAQIILKRVSKDGTIKYLFQMNDGELIESVLMKYAHGYSICISTQVGCKMNCSFCATGKSGFSRDLLPSEMLSQVQEAQQDENIRISNIVLMGMGEPLDNYDNVIRFLELVSHPDGMNIGMRHISLSTCGLVDRIYNLAEKKLQLTLSISLHAPNDEIRNRTMPVNRRWNVEQLLAACRHYSRETGRRISFEYAMISGINDSDQCARELASRLHGMTAHVNLIPINDVTDTGYKKSDIARQKRFISILELGGCTATVRRTLGSDIEASCGQLSRKHKGGNGYEG